MAIVNGTVAAISTKFGKFGICVDDRWFNTNPEWLSVKPEKGDVVEFDDGGRNYIKKLKIISGGVSEPSGSSSAPSSSTARTVAPSGVRTFPVGVTAPERTINRQNALTNAVAYMRNCKELGLEEHTPEQVIETARLFEAYTTGDLDMQEAEQALKEMEGA